MMKRLAFLFLFFAPICGAQCALNTTSVGWTWTCPALGMSWAKVNLLSKTDITDVQSATTHCTGGVNCLTQMKTKYGVVGSNYAPWEAAISARMVAMGFTGAGFDSSQYKTSWTSGNLPYEFSSEYGIYAIQDTTNGITGVAYHVKDAGWINSATSAVMKCGSIYYKALTTPDPYDPEFLTAYSALYLAALGPSHLNSTQKPGMLFFNADDGDYMAVMNLVDFPNSHPDYGLIIAEQSPIQPVSSFNAGGAYTFSNQTYFAKQAMRDWLLNEYLCTGAGTPVSTCTGSQIGTGSADPSSGSYVGSTPAATALAAFNTAWGESYTTWNTSDSGGLAGIASGTYASYSTGTGFLDEAGTSLVGIACGGSGGNGPQQNQSWATVPQVQTDVDHFMAYGFAATWAANVWAAYSTACTTYSACVPLAISSYDGPHTPAASSIYAGMATAFAGHSVLFWLSGPTAAVAQDIINHDGNMPVIEQNYSTGQPDSYITPMPVTSFSINGSNVVTINLAAPYTSTTLAVGVSYTLNGFTTGTYLNTHSVTIASSSAGTFTATGITHAAVGLTSDAGSVGSAGYLTCAGQSAINCQNTQPLRGAEWAAFNLAHLRLKNPAGQYAVVGFEHWGLWDSYSQGYNQGLFTDNDNAYDGSSASTATSSGACAINTVYTIPAICQDGNGNYESLSLGPSITTCTSGGTAPTWAVGYGAQTIDGTCRNWFNDGAYAQVVEAGTWGNSLLPIVTFNLSNLADPSSNAAGSIISGVTKGGGVIH